MTALVHRALADGATGVLVTGSTGEGALLDPEQRVRVAAQARAALDGYNAPDAPSHSPRLLAGASGLTPAALHEDVARLAGAGADLVLVLAPHTYPLTPRELTDLHLEVAERADVPTLCYHIPQLTGSALTPDAVTELAGHPRIVGMKDSSPDTERRAAFVAATADREGFDVCTGHAPSLLAALSAGVPASITAIANLRQHQVTGLHAAVAAGDAPRAERLQAALTRLSAAIGEVTGSVPATLKAVLQLDGVIAERWCRSPLASVPPDRLDQVRTALLR